MRNVVLLTLDATRKDVFGLYGSTRGLTPTFDEFGAESLVFTNAQTTGPYTQASFPGILTSSYYLDFGRPKGLSPHRTLVSEPLQRAGVATAAFHSNPYLCEFLGWNRGWDRFYDSMDEDVDPKVPYVHGDHINRMALDWLAAHRRAQPRKPFFLWLHYMDVHEPYMPERRFLEAVAPSLAMSRDEMYALFQKTLLPRDASDPDRVSILRRLYDAHVREIDAHFAQLLSGLEDLDCLAATTVFVTSDHGDEFGEHGGLSHDDKLYCELVDAPLLIHGAEEAGTFHPVVSSIDIAPTIVALFGLPAVSGFQGRSLLPSRSYTQQGVFGEAMAQHTKPDDGVKHDVYFYREERLKIIHRREPESWELYDLATDPRERKNLMDSSLHADRMASKLLPRVQRWMASP